MDRIVALVDMDCFFVQVEQRLNPDLKGKPCAVVQYTGSGVIIAVSYEARAFGVTRGMRKRDAKAKCPGILLPKVPELRGKADLTKYREAGAEVMKVFSQFCHCVERASIDEAYLDLTNEIETKLKTQDPDILSLADKLRNTYVIGWEDNQTENNVSTNCKKHVRNWLEAIQTSQSEPDIKLAIGGCLVEQMRAAVYEQTGFRCSAGVSCNKMLAKLAAGIHKPNQQTILPHASVESFFETLPLRKVRNLGGKLGAELCEEHGVKNMSDLCQFTKQQLCDMYGRKTGEWLYALCRGYDSEPVAARQLPKSIGCSKNFPGKDALDTREKVKYWLSQLSSEVEERLLKDKEDNKRIATSMIVGLRYQDPISQNSVVSSRTVALVQYNRHKFAANAFILLQQFNFNSPHQASWTPPVNMLSISAGKFVEIGITQFGGISALLRKQINNSKFIPQISTDFETVSQNNKTPNNKKPKENTIQNLFYRQLAYNSTQKYEDEVSQSNAQEVLQSTTASKTLTNLSNEKNNKTERKLQGFFATKQKQMNCTEKDRNVFRDFGFQAKPSCNGQIQVVNSATMNSDLTVSRFFSKDCLEPENKALTSGKNSNYFSESLVNNEDPFPGLKRKFPSRQRENSLDDCIILSSDNEDSDVGYTTEAGKSSTKNFQNLHVKVENAIVGTVLCDNDCRKKLADDKSGKVNGKSTNKLMNSKASAPNMYQNTAVKCIQENSDQIYCEEIDMNVACDRETKIDLLERPNSVKTISNVSVSITSKSVIHKNALAVCEEEQNIGRELSHSGTENKQMSFETLDYVTCKECLKKVLVWDFEEHQDFHFAQKLHKSVNAEANPVSNEVPCQSWVMKKRKSKTVYATHKKKTKTKTESNMQTLELFFKK